MNKKVLIAIIIILLILVGIIFVGIISNNNVEPNGELEKNKVKVTMYDSTGMMTNPFQNNPKKTIKTCDVKLNEKIEFENMTFEIIKIDEKEITVKSYFDVLKNGNRINEFTVHKGETVRVSDLSVDLGCSFEFEINI